MKTKSSKEALFGQDLDASEHSVAELCRMAKECLARKHAAFFRNFPVDMEALTEFLSELGDILPNYDSKSQNGTAPGLINRVKYNKPTNRATYVHEKGGPLLLHTARSWREPRPRFMSMLMVEPGWRGYEYGLNGESVVVAWRRVLKRCVELDSDFFGRKLPLLKDTPICFRASRVLEEFSNRPIIYEIDDPDDDFDYGVRLKQDIIEVVQAFENKPPRFDEYLEALKMLVEVSNQPDVSISYPMDRGDIVVLDNNRFGHGRLDFIAERVSEGKLETNPREIWSATIE